MSLISAASQSIDLPRARPWWRHLSGIVSDDVQLCARHGWRGALGMALVTSVLLGAWVGSDCHTGLGMPMDTLLGAVLGAGVFGLGGALAWAGIRLLRRLPPSLAVGSFGLLTMLILMLVQPLGQLWALTLALGGLAMLLLGGICLGMLVTGGFAQLSRAGKFLFTLTALLVLESGVRLLTWWAGQGAPAPASLAQWTAPAQPRTVALENPAMSGPYPVRTLSYGSGTESRRPAYGTDVTLRTPTVDLTPFLPPPGRVRGRLRAWYWGFTPRQAPLNGRVWYPVGKGPFPLVLIVHGNNRMELPSEIGFTYLGRLLASRGYLVAAIDENYLNGSWSGQVQGEMLARGWLVWQHLAQWRRWQETPGTPFSRKVDLSRVALIGHSRGGEAVTLTAALMRLSRLPSDAEITLQPPCAVRAVIALAPTDEMVELAGHHLKLEDVDYLLLQGGLDGDLFEPVGLRQFRRVTFSPGSRHFAAAVYCFRASHNQFNTVWGDIPDQPGVMGHLLNNQALLNGETQRLLTAAYVSAFLEASLRGADGYRALWADPRTTVPWLPATARLTQYRSASFRQVATFEEDADVLTATQAGARTKAEGCAGWREEVLTFRDGCPRENHAVYLRWHAGQPASYTIHLPDGGPPPAPGDRLVFALADARPMPSLRRSRHMTPSTYRLDLTVELRDRQGHRAQLPLERLARVPALPNTELTKSAFLERMLYGNHPQPILQQYAIPLHAFQAETPTLSLAHLRAIRFTFDRSPTGAIYLDAVGFDGGV